MLTTTRTGEQRTPVKMDQSRIPRLKLHLAIRVVSPGQILHRMTATTESQKKDSCNTKCVQDVLVIDLQ